MELPDRIRAGVEALRSGRPGAAVTLLLPAAEDAELAAAVDLVDVRARVCSLLAQALLEAGEPPKAERWASEAARLATQVDDKAGLDQIRALRLRILGEAVKRRKDGDVSAEVERTAARPIESLLVGVDPGLPTAEVLLAKANAEIAVGRPHEGAKFARRAVVIGSSASGAGAAEGGPRVQVLGWLTVAAALPEEADGAVLSAWQVADEAGDTTLIAAVVQAAAQAQVALPTVPIGGRA